MDPIGTILEASKIDFTHVGLSVRCSKCQSVNFHLLKTEYWEKFSSHEKRICNQCGTNYILTPG